MRGFAVVLVMVVALSGALRADAAWFEGFKFGTGVLWDFTTRSSAESSGIGAHVSADFKPVGPFMFMPFYEVSGGKHATHIYGMNLSYAVGMRDRETHTLFFGGGMGQAALNGETRSFISLNLGYKFPVRERLGVFVLMKYIDAKNSLIDGLSGHVGVIFPFAARREEF